jgi:hypothetical protein
MKIYLFLLFCLTLSSCSTCKIDKAPCSPLACAYGQGLYSTQPTSLSYLIDYQVDGYDLVASFDVHFMDGSSTNGCTAHLSGKYGEPIQSKELGLNGTSTDDFGAGKLAGTLSSKKRYYIKGVINRPDTDEIRQANMRALSIHVEENYNADYLLK